MSYLVSGGLAMWVVLACAVVTIVMAVRAFVRRSRGPAASDGILFWGSAALTIGVIGTLIGISSMASALSAAGSAPAALVWDGVRIVLSPTIVGTGVFLLGLTASWVLRAATD